MPTSIRDRSQVTPSNKQGSSYSRSPAKPPSGPVPGKHEKGYIPTLLLLGSRNSSEKVCPKPGTCTSTPSGNWVARDVLLYTSLSGGDIELVTQRWH